jgi:peptide-methionine (S)-S-oxide reductase
MTADSSAIGVRPIVRPFEASKIEAQARLKQGRILTQILPLHTFWPAEAYHRDYAHSHALHYTLYRQGCGRDARLEEVWGR